MQFSSDTWSGAAPEIVEAIAREAAIHGSAYGGSKSDRAAEQRFAELFERDVSVYFVATGSAANALALAAFSRPAGAIFAHKESHVLEDELGGVEFLANGARVIPVGGPNGKFDPAALRHELGRFVPGSVRNGRPIAMTITQQTELGTHYSADEIRTLSAIAKERGLPLHMDGARLANAVAALGVSPAEITWKAGVDVLSFGATKNGCIAAEAVVFFDPDAGRDMPFIRKRAGHLFSKSRFMAAQFDTLLKDGLWLRLARQANAMADRLRSGLADVEAARVAWPTHGNEVFVIMRRATADRLEKLGASFYDWPEPQDTSIGLKEGESLYRLVASHSTRPEEVDTFIAALRG